MKKSAIAIAFGLIGLLARPQILLAQATQAPIKGSWDGIKAVPPGDELVVSLRNGKSLKGRFSGITDIVLTIDHDRKKTDLSRGEVLKVYRLISKSATRSTMIGLGIGAAVGGVSGGVAAASGPGESGEYGWGVLIVGTIGLAIGSLVGYLIGSRKHRALIYETT
ncbi:MAG: hypothetical protein L0220_02685 [Acidobacteria bacterium]|nr:hypothetical protein [Acidobacteriota bacterium]